MYTRIAASNLVHMLPDACLHTGAVHLCTASITLLGSSYQDDHKRYDPLGRAYIAVGIDKMTCPMHGCAGQPGRQQLCCQQC